MAGKSKVRAQNDDPKEAPSIERIKFGTELQWVASNLDAGDKEWLLSNRDHSIEYVGEFLDDLTADFVLTIKPDDKSGRYLATLVCTNKDHPAAARAISSRARTAFDAVYSLSYLALGKWDTPWYEQFGSDPDDPWS